MNLQETITRLLEDPSIPPEDIAARFAGNPTAAAEALAEVNVAAHGGDMDRFLLLYRLLRNQKPFQEQDPVIKDLGEVTPKPIRWLWRDRIPFGKLTLLAGHPGQGKSLLSLDIIARLSTGASCDRR